MQINILPAQLFNAFYSHRVSFWMIVGFDALTLLAWWKIGFLRWLRHDLNNSSKLEKIGVCAVCVCFLFYLYAPEQVGWLCHEAKLLLANTYSGDGATQDENRGYELWKKYNGQGFVQWSNDAPYSGYVVVMRPQTDPQPDGILLDAAWYCIVASLFSWLPLWCFCGISGFRNYHHE